MKYKAVICFSALEWNFLRQRTHYIMEGMATRGLKVLFVENTGVRNPRLNDFNRILNRLKNAAATGNASNSVPDNMEIFSPMVLPFPYNKPAIYYNGWYMKKYIDVFLARCNLLPSEVIFWTYLTTPVIMRLTKDYLWGKVVYDVVSDPKLVEKKLAPYEKMLLMTADKVLFASHVLYEQYRPVTRKPVVFEDGFNTGLLEAKIKSCLMDNLPSPKFLYIGGINRKLWPEMIESLCAAFPGGSVTLIGPVSGDTRLPNLPNLHILPPCSDYRELAPYLENAGAGIIPYYNDDYAGAMHPAKLNEYIIFGLPVVATATPELTKLDQTWGKGFFYLGANPEEFICAATTALADDTVNRESRKAFAVTNTWDVRLEELFDLIE